MSQIPLYKMFPGLENRLSRVPLMTDETPVRYLKSLSRDTGSEIWLKNDSATAPEYGGNKPRKLEFLMADARKHGCSRLLTVGGIGSNHCMATLIHGRKAGFEVTLLLFPQPETKKVLRYRDIFLNSSAEIILGQSYESLPGLVRNYLDTHPATYYICAGGSSAVGCLGFVNAALELSEQIKNDGLPVFDEIIIPAGTCGTLAGLVLGLKLAGLKIKVTGVRVVDTFVANPDAVNTLINETRAMLRECGAVLPQMKICPRDFEIREGYFGPGYGEITPESEHAVAVLGDCENLQLETTYTGKAAAALLDGANRPSKRIYRLFWNTYAGPLTRRHKRPFPAPRQKSSERPLQ